MKWLKQVLTGADNETVAIGRLIGAAIAVVLLIGVPVAAVVSSIIKLLPPNEWSTLLGALGIYVPLVTAAVGGLIWGTASTEPKPKDDGQ